MLEPRQRVQVRQLCNPVLGEDQCPEVGYARGEVRLDVRDAVLREQEGSETRLEGEVAELCDVVVGKIYSIVVL